MQRQQAEENLKRARQAVDQYFTRVSQSKLFDVPTLLPLRKELLEDAARYYQTLLSERGDNPALLADLAVADLRLAEIDHEVDRNDDAIDALASGLELVERLHSKFPDAKEEQRRVAGFWKANRDPEAGHRDAEGPGKGQTDADEVCEPVGDPRPRASLGGRVSKRPGGRARQPGELAKRRGTRLRFQRPGQGGTRLVPEGDRDLGSTQPVSSGSARVPGKPGHGAS